ncbi:unnamed protein product [Effrenium voratum]|nr:unnamed protein product [Effrenium voratum]
MRALRTFLGIWLAGVWCGELRFTFLGVRSALGRRAPIARAVAQADEAKQAEVQQEIAQLEERAAAGEADACKDSNVRKTQRSKGLKDTKVRNGAKGPIV